MRSNWTHKANFSFSQQMNSFAYSEKLGFIELQILFSSFSMCFSFMFRQHEKLGFYVLASGQMWRMMKFSLAFIAFHPNRRFWSSLKNAFRRLILVLAESVKASNLFPHPINHQNRICKMENEVWKAPTCITPCFCFCFSLNNEYNKKLVEEKEMMYSSWWISINLTFLLRMIIFHVFLHSN